MRKINVNIWILVLVFVGLFSCSDDNTIEAFEDSPAQRVADEISELRSLLINQPQGFKGVYFSKNDTYGGFTFYMNFKEDGTVTMTSDFDSDIDIQTSSYEIRQGTTAAELVFTTRNHIQKVSDNLRPILTGFEGTSVFQYFGNENGVVTFRDIRNRNTAKFVFEPSGFTDFDAESVVEVQAILEQKLNLNLGATSPVFQVLKIENSNGTSSFNMNYTSSIQFASPRIIFDDGTVTEFNFGVAFTTDGLVVSPALEYEGEAYTEFIYDETSASYISEVNGATATILFGDQPAFIGRDIEELAIVGPTGFLYRRSLGVNPLTSQGFETMLSGITNSFIANGFGEWNVSEILLVVDFESDDCATNISVTFQRVADGARFGGIFCFNRGMIQDRKLFLDYIGPVSANSPLLLNNPDLASLADVIASNSAFFESYAQPIIDFFNSEKGLIYTNEGGFISDINRFSNSAATFTSLDTPSLRIYGLWFG